MKAPFTYFGGKSKVSDIVWQALGQPAHYIEPFFGSGAVLLNRPEYNNAKHTETVNDKDENICNVWRALQADPDAVAKVCDWPVNHADLSARKLRLIKEQDTLLANLIADDKYYHVELAGYWIWAASCWIGSGMLSIGQVPHISGAGKGVHAAYNTNIYQWFRELSERLRRVRVVCGDWERVCGGNWQTSMGDCGIFFDPPYSDAAKRTNKIYTQDSLSVAHDVRKWCIERGSAKDYRIILAGYTGEHEELADHGWKFQTWKAKGGYGNLAEGAGKQNRHKEILWFSPHCANAKTQIKLF